MDIAAYNNPRPDRIRVVVVDDHPAIRDAVASVVRTKLDMQFCGGASSARDALRLFAREQPDVAIVDVSLQDGNGLDVVRQARDQFPSVYTIVFSMYEEDVYAERALQAGASGYLMKSVSTQIIVDAIRCASQGDVYVSPRIASRLVRQRSSGRARPALGTNEFTTKERTVFEMLGEGLSIDEIAEQLQISSKTVATYRRHAKEKLGYDKVSQLLQHATQWRLDA